MTHPLPARITLDVELQAHDKGDAVALARLIRQFADAVGRDRRGGVRRCCLLVGTVDEITRV